MNKGNYLGRVQYNVPVSTYGLDFTQNQILLAAKAASIAGHNYILSGCEEAGNNVSPGILIINGELLPFIGGAKQDKIRIKETAETITAANEVYEQLYTKRHVEFGSYVDGTNTFDWPDFKPMPTNKYLDVHKVPNDRTINGKALDNDVVLSAKEIGAATTDKRKMQPGDCLLAYDKDGNGFLLDVFSLVITKWETFGDANAKWRLYNGILYVEGEQVLQGTDVPGLNTIAAFTLPIDITNTWNIEVPDTAQAAIYTLYVDINHGAVSLKMNKDDIEANPAAAVLLNFNIDLL
ncbi:MAG: hypothetical protein LBN98_03480 [Prevotellaceae bacterium]|jgi:hypothetical protein|nr:hypothetical protein [Prevotellaceae bacterium]